jgi:hypothetical protein
MGVGVKTVRYVSVALAALILSGACGGNDKGGFPAQTQGVAIPKEPVVDLNKGLDPPMLYTQDFNLKDCKWKPHGVNTFYDPLVPGFKSESHLPGKVGERAKKPVDYLKTYEVLNETKKLNIQGLGKLEAAIVEEKEFENGKQIQLSVNWYSICSQTNAVYAMGEDSFALDPDTGKVLDTEGSWLAGKVNPVGEVAIPSLAMASNPSLGSRTIFDGAPGVALGGAEVIAMVSMENGTMKLPPTREGFKGGEFSIPLAKSVGDFQGCLQIQEISQNSATRRPDLNDLTNKVWCPGVGLIYDTSDGAITKSNALEDKGFQKKLAQFKPKK